LTTSSNGCGLCLIRRRKRVLSSQFFWGAWEAPCWLYRPRAAETPAGFSQQTGRVPRGSETSLRGARQ
jgi:hypothetical protein